MLNKREEEDYFSMYCEDYNTCTLPDEKYYNIRSWEMREASKRGLKTVQELYTDTNTMTDEEKAAMERRRLQDELRKKQEDARTFAMMQALREVKAENHIFMMSFQCHSLGKVKGCTKV